MENTMLLELYIPVDSDGFINNTCELCHENFKLDGERIQDEDFIGSWCPNCGLFGQSFLGEDENEQIEQLVENAASQFISDSMKELEKSFSSGFLSFNATNKIPKSDIQPLISKLGNLEEIKYQCCGALAKISPILNFIGGYCPYCGEVTDGN